MMQRHDGIWFPDVDFIEAITTQMVPILFPRYDDGVGPDFQYLGGDQGVACWNPRWRNRDRALEEYISTRPYLKRPPR